MLGWIRDKSSFITFFRGAMYRTDTNRTGPTRERDKLRWKKWKKTNSWFYSFHFVSASKKCFSSEMAFSVKRINLFKKGCFCCNSWSPPTFSVCWQQFQKLLLFIFCQKKFRIEKLDLPKKQKNGCGFFFFVSFTEKNFFPSLAIIPPPPRRQPPLPLFLPPLN